MFTSTSIDKMVNSFGYETAIRMTKEAGFDAFDLSLFGMVDDDDSFNQPDYREKALSLRKYADSIGIVCNQSHAPFPSSRKQTEENAAYNATIEEKIHRAIEIAGILGAKSIVVHPKQHLPYLSNVSELKEINRGFYQSLVPYCKQFGIRVAVENMWQTDPHRKVIVESVCARPEEFRAYMESLDPACFTACLDIGHCGLTGHSPAETIRALGGTYLGALHVHETDYFKDLHTLPFQAGGVDWEETLNALAEVGYAGDFTLESMNFLNRLPDALLAEGLRFMASTAKHLRDRLAEKMGQAR